MWYTYYGDVMKETLAILVNKAITFTCKVLRPILKKDGSVTPGYYASKIDSKILDKLKYPKYVVGITGSSGKGSTTSLVAHILEGNGYKVIWNKNGSNVYNAAATLILNNTNPFTKKVNADVLLLELDESFIKFIFNKVKMTHLVITNVTRDQPARNGHPDIIFKKIKNSFDANTHIIINADDPIVNRFKYSHTGDITTYGVASYINDTRRPISNTVDAAYCPLCETKLKYKYYHYGHVGNYHCPNCKFTRGKVDYEASEINLEKQFMIINKGIVHLNKNVFFAVYYTLAAYALCKSMGLTNKQIQKELNEDIMDSKRMKNYYLGKRKVEMIESKNENALSYLQTINYIRSEKGPKTIIMGFDNVSRRYEFNDLSWLYDVDFELLNDKSINKIFCIGRFRYDVYARLLHANIPKDKIILVDNLDNILLDVRKYSKGKIYTMVCFDMTAILKQKLMEELHGNN